MPFANTNEAKVFLLALDPSDREFIVDAFLSLISSGNGTGVTFFSSGTVDNEWFQAGFQTVGSNIVPAVVPVTTEFIKASFTNQQAAVNQTFSIFVNGAGPVDTFTVVAAKTGVFDINVPVSAGDRISVFASDQAGTDRAQDAVITLYT